MNELSTWAESVQLTRAREVEEGYRQLAELSPDGLLVLVEGQIVFANAAFLEIFGGNSFDLLIGQTVSELFKPVSAVLLEERLRLMQKEGQIFFAITLQMNRLDQSTVEVEATSGLLTWKGANAVQICLRSLVNRGEHDKQLRESEARFHQLADAMPQIVWMAGPDGVIDYHNKKWFEQTGLTEEEGNRADIWEKILHPNDVSKAVANWERCVQSGEPFQMEYRYKELNGGGYRWHLGRALPVKDENGKVIRWFGTCTDIHDHKLAEIALEEAKEQLAQSASELEKLVAERTTELEETVRSAEALNYSLAHDLRAPLRAMMGFSNALLEDHSTVLDSTGREYAGRIAAGAKRMDGLIASLLSYGRLNYEELSFGFINTQSILETLINDFAPEIQATAAQVTLDKPLPNVWANAPVLRKVLKELIENALKFCGHGKTPQIEIWAEERETKNLIWIRDNGIGIPAEHHERIFRVMESLHAGDKYPGHGIGLAIVRRGVERLGGRIGLKSAPDQGSCFWIELPKALF